MERDREHLLGGFIQLDDAYLGGERSGGKRGRGAPGKTPFVAAVETNEQGHPLRVKFTVVEGFRLTEIAAWAQQHLSPGTQVLSDGLACFNCGQAHPVEFRRNGRAQRSTAEFESIEQCIRTHSSWTQSFLAYGVFRQRHVDLRVQRRRLHGEHSNGKAETELDDFVDGNAQRAGRKIPQHGCAVGLSRGGCAVRHLQEGDDGGDAGGLRSDEW